jgi:hypothetical protein
MAGRRGHNSGRDGRRDAAIARPEGPKQSP